jgi:hypothetical protein
MPVISANLRITSGLPVIHAESSKWGDHFPQADFWPGMNLCGAQSLCSSGGVAVYRTASSSTHCATSTFWTGDAIGPAHNPAHNDYESEHIAYLALQESAAGMFLRDTET